MSNARDALNELKWKHDRKLEDVEVYYVHRGAPGDFKVLRGEDISDLGRSFIKLTDGRIPYHRVFKIKKDGKEFFSRPKE